jgi:CBS domain containing-hemolysin-like protein
MEGTVDEGQEMIENVLELREHGGQTETPRTDLVAVAADADLPVLETIRKVGHSASPCTRRISTTSSG